MKNYKIYVRNIIQFIYGRPYYPQSQGVVEKINEFSVQPLQALYTDFIDSKQNDEIRILRMLSRLIANANINVHSVT